LPTSTSRPRAAERGVTLLELLVVISVLGVLLGLGVGVYGSLATPDSLAAGRIKDALRAARLMAQREGLPASVVIDPPAGEVRALGLRAAGNWHFEDAAGTGWPVPARHEGATLDPDGALGSSLVLGEEATLAVPDLPPAADDPQGFGVEAFVAPAAAPRPMVLLERPGRWALRLDDEDVLQVSLWLDARPAPEELRRAVPEVRLVPGRFTRLAVLFDGRTLHVAADGRRCGEDTRLPAVRRLAGAPGVPLSVGAGLERFRGRLDELRLFAVASEQDAAALPDTARLLGAPRLLRLDATGRLDPAFHAAPEVLGFEWGEPPRRSYIELGLLGALREWTEGP
jgi:prepilin-type N-terminal cleavage/methylation domain-containing protein